MLTFRCVLLSVLLWLGAAQAQAAPLDVYGRLPSIDTAAISPAGTTLAVIVTNGEERRLLVKDLVHNQVVLLATVGDSKVRDLQWVGDDKLVVTNSHTGTLGLDILSDRSEWYFASLIDIRTKKLKRLLSDEVTAAISGAPMVRTVNGKPALFLQGYHSVENAATIPIALFSIDLDQGKARVVEVARNHFGGFVVDSDGRPLAQRGYDDRRGKWTMHLNGPQGWREAVALDAPTDTPDVLGLGRDGHSVLVDASWDEDAGFREVSSNGLGPILAAQVGRFVIHDEATGRLIGSGSMSKDEQTYSFFDPADARVWKAVVAAHPGARVSFVSWSTDRSKIIARVDSPSDGPAYALIDIAARKSSWLGGEYDALKPSDISPVQPLSYKAADGLPLSGYLTLPAGRERKGLPLIVLPHGGPASRDVPGFDWWAQALASRGYAVMQVNFRGSEGFGWDFVSAGFGQWGRKMQTDLSDGVRHLAAEGVIDPKRVCIVGASYGGYAALAGITIDPGVYRCAASFGGISDLRKMLAFEKDQSGSSAVRYWTRYMGAESPTDPVLTTYSPSGQAAKAAGPVLLIHGKDDTVVPLEQSRVMADALRAAGKPVQLVVLDSTDHWLTQGKTRLTMLQSVVDFLEKHNPPN